MLKNSDFVYRGSYKWDAFLSMVSKRLTGDEKWNVGPDGLYYFGAGYWRGQTKWLDCGMYSSEQGISLINPDKSHDEIRIVTAALNILIGRTR